MDKKARKVYPQACTSAHCGRIDCTGCPNKPALDEFEAWVRATRARPADPIWSPLVYVVKEQ